MRLTRSAVARAALAAFAAGSIAGALVVPAAAQAAPGANASAETATGLATRLGAHSAGAYFDQNLGKMVVTVTDAGAARQAVAAGAVAKQVRHSGAQLARATDSLDASARIVGTAWAVDVTTNQVVVSVDDSVTGANLATVQAVVKGLGDLARLERTSGTFSPFITGGDAIYTGGARCSLGFNVRNSAGTYFFLTAGHCTNIGATWSNGSSTIGTRTGTSFPTNDFGIVRYTSSISHPGMVDLYNGTTQDITTAGNAFVGQSVSRSGSTTHVHSGSVTATNATVNYAQGTVYGLIRTTVCAEPGDSGGSLFSGSTALGLTSGGSGNCSSGGTTFFQPVTEPLSVYGVSVY